MKNNISELLDIVGISIPPIGVYDVTNIKPFEPFADPGQCIFAAYEQWLAGKSSVIDSKSAGSYACPGAGYWLCGIEGMPRAAMAGYLANQEGFKVSASVMHAWLDNHPPYQVKHESIVISQLKADQYEFLNTVTFFVNADQLGLMLTGAEYLNASADRRFVSAPYGAGCGQLLPLFRNLDEPMAIIGATDIAMRRYLPPDILAFTVTKPMFEQLCALDENSFLYKSFWDVLKQARA